MVYPVSNEQLLSWHFVQNFVRESNFTFHWPLQSMCLWSDHVYYVICPPYKDSPYVKVQSLKILINTMLTAFLFGLTRIKCHVLGPYLDFLFVQHIWHSFVSTAYTPKYLNSQPVSTTKYFKPSKMSYFSRTKVEDFN